MCKRLMVLVLVLGLVGMVQAATMVFSDDFDTPHDYASKGVIGPYDGIVNGSIEALDASISRPGALYIQSVNGMWEGASTGALLYVNWTGDFTATVKVTDFAGTIDAPVFHNYAGILARDPASDTGPENWVSVDYFPTWTAFIAWNNDDDVRTEHGQVVGRWTGADTYALAAQYPYLQLERKGSNFYPRISADGVNFFALTDPAYSGTPDGTQTPLVINRPDLPATLQVGLSQATHSAESGYVAFDDFKIVPEPATIALLGLGGLALIRRKRG